MSVKIDSTTDTAEQVAEAAGQHKPAEGSTDQQASVIEDVKPDSEPVADPEKDKTSQDESDESEASTDDEGDDSDDGDDAEDEREASGEDATPKRKSRFKRRIDKLRGRASDAERERDYWRQQALNNQRTDKPEVEKPTEQVAEFTKAKPVEEDYDDLNDFYEALTDWKLEEREFKSDQKARKDQQKIEQEDFNKDIKAKVDKLNSGIAEFAKEHPDFHDLLEDNDDIGITADLQLEILNSDNGPALMYHLNMHREDYEKIAKLQGNALSRALGRFEAKYLSDEKPPKKEANTITKAPKPIAPLGGGRKTSATVKPLDEVDYQEYKRRRAAGER